MIIRDYIEDDYPRVAELWNETGLWDELRGDTKESIGQCLSIGGIMLIMEDKKENQVVGTSWVTFDGRRMFLHHFCIKPSYQGMGYGKELTEATLRFLKRVGYQVKLEVHADNLPAIRLYEKYGFFRFEDYNVFMIRDVKNIRV